jgi:hypothetical protein
VRTFATYRENVVVLLLLGDYVGSERSIAENTMHDIWVAFRENDIEKVIDIITKMFKTMPPQFFMEDFEKIDKNGNKTIVVRQVGESFYHAIIYLIFNLLAIRMRVELSVGQGRIDATVETNTRVYIFEFKKGRNPKEAIQQIWDKKYADAYSLSKKPIVLIGLCFTMQKRGISGTAIVPIEDVENYLKK